MPVVSVTSAAATRTGPTQRLEISDMPPIRKVSGPWQKLYSMQPAKESSVPRRSTTLLTARGCRPRPNASGGCAAVVQESAGSFDGVPRPNGYAAVQNRCPPPPPAEADRHGRDDR